MILRDYQEDARRSSHGEWGKGVRSTIGVLPTGTGKTVLAAHIIKDFMPKRAMFVAHRRELIFQAAKTIANSVNLECGIEMAELAVNDGLIPCPVVCAMVQTLNGQDGMTKRMGRFKPKDFGLLVIDEFHHSVADTYKNIINYFVTNNPDIKILGLTATPDRADEEALGQVCESVAFDYEIMDAIRDGWLVRPDQYCAHVAGLDFSHIHTVAGELNQGELAKVMEAEGPIHGVVQFTMETMFRLPPHELDKYPVEKWGQVLGDIPSPRRTLVFTVSVLQAETLCNIFNRVVPGLFGWVCGDTATKDRDKLLRQFESGEVVGVVNCNCLSEGFDNPWVELVVQARPTKSRSLYAQQIGRGLRPLPGLVDKCEDAEARRLAIAGSYKPNCIVLDFVGNSGKHQLVTVADILGGKVSDKAVERSKKMAEKLGSVANVVELLAAAEKMEQDEVLRLKAIEEKRKAKVVAKAKYNVTVVNPFSVFSLSPVKPRGWDTGKVLSDKQRRLLLREGLDPDSLPYGQACQLIDEIFRRWKANECGFKLAKSLKTAGLPTNVSSEQAIRSLKQRNPNAIVRGGAKTVEEDVRWEELSTTKPE